MYTRHCDFLQPQDPGPGLQSISWLIDWMCLSVGHYTTSQTWGSHYISSPLFFGPHGLSYTVSCPITAIPENGIMVSLEKMCIIECWSWCGRLLLLLKIKIPEDSHDFLIVYILSTINWRILSRAFAWPPCVWKKPLWLVDWLESKLELGVMNSEALTVEKVKW